MRDLFYNSQEEYSVAVSGGMFGADQALDCKAYLEEYFNIKFWDMMTKEQVLNAFYLAVYEAGLADSNASLKLDTYFRKHLDDIEKDKQLTLELWQ